MIVTVDPCRLGSPLDSTSPQPILAERPHHRRSTAPGNSPCQGTDRPVTRARGALSIARLALSPKLAEILQSATYRRICRMLERLTPAVLATTRILVAFPIPRSTANPPALTFTRDTVRNLVHRSAVALYLATRICTI